MWQWVRAVWATVFRRAALDADLDAELASAVDELASRHEKHGVSRVEARRRASMAVGGVRQVTERTRSVRPGVALETLLRDLRHIGRGLRKAKLFSLSVIATFTLVIGVNGAVFAVVQQLFLAPLPYPHPDELVFIWSDLTAAGYPRAPLAGPELKDLREGTTSFRALGAIWANTAALTGGDDPEQLRIGLVTANFFDVVGVAPALGRTFVTADEEQGAAPTILLSWELWTRRFGANPAVVGSNIDVNGAPTVVIGVMPAEFRLWLPLDANVPADLQAWRPFPRTILNGSRGQQYLRVVGRLRSGASVADANTEVAGVAARVGREYPDYSGAAPNFSALPLHADTVRDVRRPMWALFAGAVLLLLLAAVNVANLFVARASADSHQTALRLALGAPKWRLFQHCVLEAIVLAAIGGLFGVLLTAGLLELVVLLKPAGLSRLTNEMPWQVSAYCLLLALAWGISAALAPFLAVMRKQIALSGSSQWQANRLTAGAAERRTRAALLSVQVAISFVLIVAASLLAHSYGNIVRADLGFSPRDALTFRLAVPQTRYRTIAHANAFQAALTDRLMQLPGVTSVALVSHLPFDNIPNWSTPYRRIDAPPDQPARDADARAVSPGFFKAVGAVLLAGREFQTGDAPGAPFVAIVDDSLATRMWPGEDPIGKRLRADPTTSGSASSEVIVVGVVKHLRHRAPDRVIREQIYFPQRQALRNPITFMVWSTTPPGDTLGNVRQVLRALDPHLPIFEVRGLSEYVERATSVPRFSTVLALGLSGAAVVLAAIGMYAVVASAVVRRRREFAVRLAIGARPGEIVSCLLAETTRCVVAGMAVGAAGALSVARALQPQLYDVHPVNGVAFGTAITVVIAATAAAVLGPGVRAATVPATESLRAI